jgi:hypothetical protein
MQDYIVHFVDAARYGLIPFLVILVVNLVTVAAMVGLGRLVGLPQNDVRMFDVLMLSACFGAIGIGIGLFLGGSRDPVVSSVVPALLTFLAAFGIYQFGKESYQPWRPVLPIALFSLILCTVCAAAFGASHRNTYLKSLRDYEEWKINYERVQIPLEYKKLEKELGLAPEKDKLAPEKNKSEKDKLAPEKK